MSKTGETKKKILKIISKKAKTPGEISKELDLAASTVTEHLGELERMGAVAPVDNPFIKKWKYYRANPNFNIQGVSELRRPISMPQIAGALVLVLGLIALLAIGMPALSASGASNQVVFSLTDPPSVPNGTQSLNITYSSLQAHYVSAGNVSGWVSGTGSGTLNLMSLINTSQVIGTGKVPANATIDMVRFAITSAQIAINNTVYNVTVPSGQLTSKVSGGGKVAANSSVLIDLSPVITTIFTQNSTIFVLVPSVKAVMIGNSTAAFHMGERHGLTGREHQELNRTMPEISISSADLSVANNSTTKLTLTVKNNANKSITLRQVLLMGMPSVTVGENEPASGNFIVHVENREPMIQLNGSMGPNGFPSGFGNEGENENANARADNRTWMINGVRAEIEENGIAKTHMPMMPNFSENGTYTNMPMMPNVPGRLGQLVDIGAKVRLFRVLNFIVAQNGTLVLPRLSGGIGVTPMVCDICTNSTGYVLAPGASVSLTFSGEILYANGEMKIVPTAGSKWQLVVSGEEGAHAQANVTAVSS